MARFSKIPGDHWSIVLSIAFLASGKVFLAQEQGVVGWDPRETGALDLNWQTVVGGLTLGLACYGFWRALTWLIESRRREQIHWRAIRLGWPALMVACGWLGIWAESSAPFAPGSTGSSALGAVELVFGFAESTRSPGDRTPVRAH